MPYKDDSTKNGTEKTTLITPTVDDDRNDNSKSNRYKYVTIAAAVSVFGLVTGTSSSSIGSSLLRQENADADTVKVMAVVEGYNLDVGCKDKYSACRGWGQGNCCGGLECDGPYFGTCQSSGCSAVDHGCAGFGQGNCCDGGVCCFGGSSSIIPGIAGVCVEYNPKGGSCGVDGTDDFTDD